LVGLGPLLRGHRSLLEPKHRRPLLLPLLFVLPALIPSYPPLRAKARHEEAAEKLLANTRIFAVGAHIGARLSPQSPVPQRDLAIEHRTILGITLGQANLSAVQRHLGKAKLWSDGDAATLEGKVCYVTQGPDSLVIIFAKNAEMAGPPEHELTDIRILSSAAYKDRANCQSLPVERDKVVTPSGLKIGISREKVRDTLGPPTKTDGSQWSYVWSIDRTLPTSHKYYEYWLARKQECFDGKNPFYTVFSEIIVKFDGDAVVALSFTRTEYIC
jgi:hypothetical protein